MLKVGNITNMTNELNGTHEIGRERYVDIKRVSSYTSLQVKTIYDWSSQGKFPCIKYGRRILFDLQDVDKAMASLKRPYLQHEKLLKKSLETFMAMVYTNSSDIQAQSGLMKGGIYV